MDHSRRGILMKTKILANYHFETKEFLRLVEADVDLASGDYVLPPYHTENISVPETTGDQYAVFVGKGWIVKTPPTSGVAWLKSDATISKVFSDYTEIPASYTLIEPTTPEYNIWNNTTWAIDKASQKADLISTNEALAKETRTSAIQADIEVFDVMWQVADADVINIQDAVDEAELHDYEEGYTVGFILADNTVRPTTKDELITVLSARRLRKLSVFEQYVAWRGGDKLEQWVVEKEYA